MRIVTALLISALSFGLMSCGSPGPRSTKAPAAAIPAAAVTAPRFSDADPHPWTGRAPQNYAVHGIDLSRFQTDVDWPTARANGVNFAFIKATEGSDRLDAMFHNHWRGAGQAGVARGAYHFFYLCGTARQQARLVHQERAAHTWRFAPGAGYGMDAVFPHLHQPPARRMDQGRSGHLP